jgi:hypothetical protein
MNTRGRIWGLHLETVVSEDWGGPSRGRGWKVAQDDTSSKAVGVFCYLEKDGQREGEEGKGRKDVSASEVAIIDICGLFLFDEGVEECAGTYAKTSR